MMYIGTSLSRCLISLANNEIQLNQVLCIITSTKAENIEQYRTILLAYIGVPAVAPDVDLERESMWKIGLELWDTGRIHQPRLVADTYGVGGTSYLTRPVPELSKSVLWLHVLPINTNATPAVVAAYEQYRILDSLTK